MFAILFIILEIWNEVKLDHMCKEIMHLQRTLGQYFEHISHIRPFIAGGEIKVSHKHHDTHRGYTGVNHII